MTESLSVIDRLGYCTIRIECKLGGGRIATGTGFFFEFNVEVRGTVPAIVTNRHIIEGASLGRLRFTTKKKDGTPYNGNYYTFNLNGFEERWIGHPEGIDLCIMPIAPIVEEIKKKGISLFYIPFNRSHVPSMEALAELKAVEDIIMVGYPNGLWDSTNNLPIFRKGITATHPKFNYNGKEEFLIDAACFPGSSGSPVLHLNVGNYEKGGFLYIGDRVMLMGVLYAGPYYTVNGDIQIQNVPTVQKPVAVSRIPNNLGVIINSNKILDFEKMLTSDVNGKLSGYLMFHSSLRKKK
jgi:hypothetical protein